MDQLKKLASLLQEHYEKVVLGFALVALALAGLLLANEKQKEAGELEKYRKDISKRKPLTYAPVDWTEHRSNLKAGFTPVNVEFAPPHNVVNPVKWLRRVSDNVLIKVEKGSEIGIEALKTVKITPLYLTINLDKASGASGYFISVSREAATNVLLRKKIQSYVTPNTKDRTGCFTFKEAKGEGDDAEVTLELLDSADKVAITRDKPYQKIEGYKADFFYPPEQKPFAEKRVGDFIILAGETNSVIDIKSSEVIFSNPSNGKRTTLKLTPAP